MLKHFNWEEQRGETIYFYTIMTGWQASDMDLALINLKPSGQWRVKNIKRTILVMISILLVNHVARSDWDWFINRLGKLFMNSVLHCTTSRETEIRYACFRNIQLASIALLRFLWAGSLKRQGDRDLLLGTTFNNLRESLKRGTPKGLWERCRMNSAL